MNSRFQNIANLIVGESQKRPWATAAFIYMLVGLTVGSLHASAAWVMIVTFCIGVACLSMAFQPSVSQKRIGGVGAGLSLCLFVYAATNVGTGAATQPDDKKQSNVQVSADISSITPTATPATEQPAPAVSENAPSSAIGQEGVINNSFADNRDSPCSDDEDTLFIAISAIQNKDSAGLAALVNEGKVNILKHKTKVRIVAIGDKGAVKIKVLSGPMITQETWVPFFSLLDDESFKKLVTITQGK